MRKLLVSITAVAALAFLCGAPLRAEGLARTGSNCGCESVDSCACDPCGGRGLFGCGGRGYGHGHHHHAFEGQQAHFNCGCNGSYKFPVPPLSTYHWPGMWSHQLMTDYHSPWRFPPLKPYVDEVVPAEMGSEDYLPRTIHQASAEIEAAPGGQSFSFSSRVQQFLR